MSARLLSLKTKVLGRSSSLEERTSLFRSLYMNHNQYVRKTLYWVVGQKLVDDAVQETFVSIWKKIDQFEGRANVKTWIYRIAINSGISLLRKNKKYMSDESFEGEDISSDSTSSDIFLQKIIENAILSLDEKFRVVFVLYYKQELTVKEVSESLKIPEGTVKSRLHSGRDTFKHYLEKNGVSYEL